MPFMTKLFKVLRYHVRLAGAPFYAFFRYYSYSYWAPYLAAA